MRQGPVAPGLRQVQAITCRVDALVKEELQRDGDAGHGYRSVAEVSSPSPAEDLGWQRGS